MCGIAGATGVQQDDVVSRMTAALKHRGPDDEAYYRNSAITLGFRRLSIVDIDGGRQPIANETEDLVLVCNGEIYNSPELRTRLVKSGHSFRTESDVEVILHLYEERGPDCVRELEGMFAFALWDVRERRLLLARDHMGQKPLYYVERDGNLYFASEVQALLAGGAAERELDVDALWHYLSLRFIPDSHSLIRGIRKLPAATWLTYQNGDIRSERYWQIDFRNKLKISEADAVEALDEQLRRTTRTHLLSDVPVGAFLSGGIDSTTIACMAARESGYALPTFSIGVDAPSFDELPAAREVAAFAGLPFHGERVRPDIARLLPKMVFHLGEPADAYGVGIFLVSKLASQHVKVCLSGDGGDESFGGYDRYAGQGLVDLYACIPAGLRRHVLSRLIDRVPETFRYKSLAQKLRWLHEMADFSGGERYAQALGFLRFTPQSRAELFTESGRRRVHDDDSVSRVLRHFQADNVDELTDRMLHTDLMTRVTDHNLVMSDRMSMACSLEVRSPFVDPRLVEFAARLPVDLKVRRGHLKYLLRKVAARYVPADVVRRPKQGFGFPVGQWMRDDLGNAIRCRMRESKLVAHGLFDGKYLERIVQQHQSGQQDHSYRLWLLLGLEIWHDIYIEGKAPESVIP